MTLAIFHRELRSQFATPLAWVLLATVQFLAAYVFLISFEDFLLHQEQLRADARSPGLTAFVIPRFFAPLGAVLVLVTPLISMRLIAGERQAGTLRLLLSAPVDGWQIVAGKYLAALTQLSVALAIACLMPLTLSAFVALDLGALAAAALGVWLAGAAALALGVYCSAVAGHPLSAAVSTFGLLLLLWLIGGGGAPRAELTELSRYIGLPGHLQSFLRGLIDTRDLAYFVVLGTAALTLAARHVERERL